MRDYSHVKRIVVKVGTNLLSSSDGIDDDRIDAISAQIAALKERGYQVLLVSSGSIGLGAKELRIKGKVKQIPLRQACASIGQPLLMTSWRRSFKKSGLLCSQVLLTRRDLNNRLTYVNLRNSITTLLELGVVPVFNENDTVSTVEIGVFGDNDRMSAMVASKIDAELLIILTDIEGLYTADPRKDESARLLGEVEILSDEVLSYAGGAGSTHSTGGMKTKLLAAKIAAVGGCGTIIASGYERDVLLRLIDGELLGTYIHPAKRMSQRQRWILNNSHLGSIEIDSGAKEAILKKKSLLPSGVVRVNGTFSEGDVVQVYASGEKPFAKAAVYLNATEISRVAGHPSADVEKLLGRGHKTMIFRPEDMVLLDDGE